MNRIRHSGLRRQVSPAVGNNVGMDRRSCAIRFDNETFDIIRARAVRRRTSFAEQVRILIEQALAAEEATELQRRRA